MAAKLGSITGREQVAEAPAAGLADRPAAVRARKPAKPLSPLAEAFARPAAVRPVLIAVPLYRRPDLAHRVAASLLRCAAEVRVIGGEVLFINDSPDDVPLAAALEDVADGIGEAFPCRILVNPQNLGFVKAANRAIAEAVERGMDLLLLNSDTALTPGALTEMVRVSRLDPMIGFVNPRSNNATLATLPMGERFQSASQSEAEAAWRFLSAQLPELSYVPTAIGFCMLVRWPILAEFGGFDEIYGRGYNEENDLVMRAGRRGYRAVLANHAFVWHEGGSSFGRSPEALALETRNRAVLLDRYPEYERLTEGYFDSPEHLAERLLETLIPGKDGRVDVALDFSTFPLGHNGTSIAGEQLLAAASELWRDRFRLYVLASQEVYDFHGWARYGAPRRDPHGPERFAGIFRVGQPYDWNTVERMVFKGATLGAFMLDTISMDCAQLTSADLERLWGFLLENLDLLAATSELTDAQLERRLPIGRDVLRVRSLHSLDLADYRMPTDDAVAAPAPPGFIFVVGNHFWHKEVAVTVNALAEADPQRHIVVLAGPHDQPPPSDSGRFAPRGMKHRPNIVRLNAGALTHEEIGAVYRDASLVVFPSHYEGFGIPLLNALAAKKPVLIRPLPVFEEMIRRIGEDPNIHVFQTTAELVRLLETPIPWQDQGVAPGLAGDGRRAAEEVGEAVDRMVAHADYQRIVSRIRAMLTLRDYSALHPNQPAPGDSRAYIAASIGGFAERLARRFLDVPGVLTTSRRCYRALRWVTGRRAA